MSWRRAEFKGKAVWAQVRSDGALDVEGGRVPIRYQAQPGARVYRAGASRVTLVEGALVETLDEGVAAPAADRGRNAGKGGRNAGKAKPSSKKRTAAEANAAYEAAQAQIRSFKGRAVLVFTDGAARGNPGPAGSGAWVETPDGRTREASRALGYTTNNVAELDAVALGLDLLDELEVPPQDEVAIFTDSTYVHGVLTRGWRAKAHPERVSTLKDRLARRPSARLVWVAGHVGIEGNERADRLANRGIEEASRRRV